MNPTIGPSKPSFLLQFPTLDDVQEFINRGDTYNDQVRKMLEEEMKDDNILRILEKYNTMRIVALSELTYHMPDHPRLLQEFAYQREDVLPHFPKVRKFLEYWINNMDGPLHSVRIAYSTDIERAPTRNGKYEIQLH